MRASTCEKRITGKQPSQALWNFREHAHDTQSFWAAAFDWTDLFFVQLIDHKLQIIIDYVLL